MEKIHYPPSLPYEDHRLLLQGLVLFSIWLSLHFTPGKVCGKGEPIYSLFTVINKKLLPNPEHFICTFRIKWITIIIKNPTLGHQLADARASKRTHKTSASTTGKTAHYIQLLLHKELPGWRSVMRVMFTRRETRQDHILNVPEMIKFLLLPPNL